MQEEIRFRLEIVSQEIEEFEIKQTWDSKRLQALCEEKQRLVNLLNLAQPWYAPSIQGKPIFGVSI